MNKFPISLDRDEKSSWLTTFVNIIIVFLILIIILQMMFYARYSRVYVDGESMYPTFTGASTADPSGGDYIFIDKKAQCEKGNIVVVTVYDPVRASNIQIIKRVIATEYDTIEIIDGVVYVNDIMLEEDYINKWIKDTTNYSKITVEANHIFVMGDNRTNSSDSRNKYGTIDVSKVVGVMTEWSYKHKAQITAYYKFLNFTVPDWFTGLFGKTA
jgi:signal peptidase I